MAYFGNSGGMAQPPGGAPMAQDTARGGMSAPAPYQQFNRFSGMEAGQDQLRQAQENLQRVQMRCAQGDGYACMQAQQLEQRMYQLAQQQQQQVGMAQAGTPRAGIMGTRGRGGGGVNQPSYAASMIGSQFGFPGFGGGGMG